MTTAEPLNPTLPKPFRGVAQKSFGRREDGESVEVVLRKRVRGAIKVISHAEGGVYGSNHTSVTEVAALN